MVCAFSVAEGPYEEVVKLQTMRCLFEAYEHVLFLLENVFTPMFCHSDEVSTQNKKANPHRHKTTNLNSGDVMMLCQNVKKIWI